MKPNSLNDQSTKPEFGVYDCEIHLKFRLVEEKGAMGDREKLLELLLDAFSCGPDEYLEPTHVKVEAQEVNETDASADMRRQIIRLRNSSNLA